jgi:hypothetical protein
MYSFNRLKEAVFAADQNGTEFYGRQWDLERIRTTPPLQKYLAEMRETAEHARQTPVTELPFQKFYLFEATGDRKIYEQAYFERRGCLLALALTTLIDETNLYLETLENLLWEICNEYTWCLPAHLPVAHQEMGLGAVKGYRLPPRQVIDLFAAETGHALAETIVLLGERLNSWLSWRVRQEITERIFMPFSQPERFWWESATMNWAAVCGGSIGMTALLLETDRERLAGILDRVWRSLDCFLEGYAGDGGCAEGISYWTYGFGYYTYFAELLRDYTGGKLDLLSGQKIRQIAEFPAHISLGHNSFINYSDGSSYHQLPAGLVSRLVHRLDATPPPLKEVAGFHADGCYRWATATRTLLWTDPDVLGKPVTAETVYFADLNWLLDRRHLNGQLVAFSAKGGHNDEPHNHNDLGHFILHVGGDNLLCDLGAGVYNRQYFGAERYSIIQNSAAGHSVPVLNGQLQAVGSQYQAKIIRQEQTDGKLNFGLDLTAAYPVAAGLQKFARWFEWQSAEPDGLARLQLLDEFDFRHDENEVTEYFISLCAPLVNAREGTVSWQGEQGRLLLHYDPTAWLAETASFEIGGFGVKANRMYRLSLSSSKLPRHIAAIFRFTLTVSSSGENG